MIYTLKVLEIRQENGDTVTVVFKQPGFKKVSYKAGQYLTLIFNINNHKYRRAYSFSSAPGVESTLNITVKRVKSGIVSNYIADHLSVGDAVEVLEPMGSFTLEAKNINQESNVVLWAAGSGITPLISIAKYALQHQIVKHVTLVYGNRNWDSTIFKDKILDLQKKYADNFDIYHFHTKTSADTGKTNLFQGRVDPNTVFEILKQEKDLAHMFHYICGPAGLKESVSLVLEANMVSGTNIFSEDFCLPIDPEKFTGIVTRNITINKASIIHQVKVTKGKTILEAGLDAEVDLQYSCQTGSCLVCKGKLLSGKLRSVLGNSYQQQLQADEWLLCCCLPLTDDVAILVD